jgi:DNA-binding transcriptional ArsR family regulator
MRRDVFQAIADPTRRAIIQLISKQPLNVNAVAENFDVSRPAISRHMRILTECGLVEIRQSGRERYCEARLRRLNEVADWIEQYRVFWTSKLDALGVFLDKETVVQQPAKAKKASIRKTAASKRKSPSKK